MQSFFLSEQVNLSVSDQLGRNFPTVQNPKWSGKEEKPLFN